jgi:hypothetical protein
MGINMGEEKKRREAAKLQEIEKLRKEKNKVDNAEPTRLPPNKPVPAKFICTQCGTPGTPKTITKGNILMELILWIMGVVLIWFFIFPILIPIAYSMWRHLSRTKGCKQCGGAMIKTDTPVGQSMLRKIQA